MNLHSDDSSRSRSSENDAQLDDDFVENDLDAEEVPNSLSGEHDQNVDETAREQQAREREAKELLQRCRDLENDVVAHINELRSSLYTERGQMKAVVDANIIKGLKNILRKLSQRSDLSVKRLGELIILDERMGIVPRLLLPLWNVAVTIQETQALEIMLFIFQRVNFVVQSKQKVNRYRSFRMKNGLINTTNQGPVWSPI
eukprot:Gregarina_sp_Poly_1__5843@NODE_307_length_9710_cov_52_151094_g264_i0_p4_GENE_NODE_307_length_9710_cov_52_151094_g264_i0NODE_307_length_9710_cov_52_151094_g264_i0_p4_ORF_typecomplete_len201_score27_36SWIRMassoc_3/PF16498_5/0_1DEDD_Tnp_IS110/PF01548_17/0_16DEDD_Tnp_IS110/PF01548_17/2_1e03DUF3461/PF11944_8/0_25DUF3461/PF11944_8/1_4e03DUF3461/PF11944_8/7_9e03_NODE_307_length_9710_cov_52_151094_g264_i029573559